MSKPALLVLEDGSVFKGIAIGADGQTAGEVVFNTAMTGYQEILTDPSYTNQIVTLTYPHIGNVGVNFEDQESTRVWAAGLIIRDLPLRYSNWRSQLSLSEYLTSQGVVGIADIDTRHLTRILREKGVMHGCIMAGKTDAQQALQAARDFPGLAGADLAKEVSTKEIYTWEEGSLPLSRSAHAVNSRPYHVVAYDFGTKRNILRLLVDHGCRVTVVPAQTGADEVLALKPDGVFLSNGPGDPAACGYAVKAIEKIMAADIPVFGICLGHQLLGLACGAQTVKLKFGHHGANHPVQNFQTGKVIISSQNHGFAVDEATLPPQLQATHHSLFDGTLQGMQHCSKPAFSFQGHPEASPGPHDAEGFFDRFVQMMER